MPSSIVVITIAQFHNCEGCRGKVENTVNKVDGAKLLTSDPDNGKFTVSTAIYDPDVIVYALKRRFPTKETTWLRDKTSLPDRLKSKHKDRSATSRSPLPPRTRTPRSSSRSIPKPKAAVYGDREQLITDNVLVEITQLTTFKLNIRKQDEKQPTGSSSVDFPMPPPPRSTILPSAPPLPSDEDGASVNTTSSRREKRPVASQVPPPATKPSPLTEEMAPRREKRRTTSSSVTSPMPPPPPRTTKPSTQPTSITEDVVRTSSRHEKRPSASSSVAFPVPPRTTKASTRPTSITEDAVTILTRREKRQTTSRSVASPRPPRTAQQPAIPA